MPLEFLPTRHIYSLTGNLIWEKIELYTRSNLGKRDMLLYSPCWSESAFRDTKALTAGNVILDIAATAPAAHIILKTMHNVMPLQNREEKVHLSKVQARSSTSSFHLLCSKALSVIYD